VPTESTLALFAVTALGVLLFPGPAVTFVIVRSLDQGATVGIVSVLGLGLGSLILVVGAAAGLSAVLATSAFAFTAVKLLGAAYLVILGLRIMLRDDDRVDPPGRRPRRLWSAFAQGVAVNVTNPKTALFFLAFLPQFVEPARGSASLQILVLGVAFVALGVVTDGAYALIASRLGGWLRSRLAFRRNGRFLTGGVYVALGVAAALGGARHKAAA
jgi:threonine/homoserine/homoserine lactone efflux protein